MCQDRAAWRLMSDPDRPLYDRVKAISYYNRFKPDPYFPESLPPPFESKGFAYAEEGRKLIRFTSEEETLRARAFCIELFNLVDASPSHPAPLDRKFSELLECEFHPFTDDSPFRHELPSEIEGMIIQRTLQLLRRLPETALELPGPTHEIPTGYFSSPRVHNTSHPRLWEDLRVASYLSTNVIRVAMCTVIYPFMARGKLSESLNHVATLLDFTAHFLSAAKTSTARYKWLITRAFLWAS